MALKNLIMKHRRKPRPSPANVIIATLRRYGVSGPVSTATGITAALRREGYNFSSEPKPR